MSENSYTDRIAAIMLAFKDALPKKITDIENHWQMLQQNWDDKLLSEFRDLSHSLAGSAATFEYDEVGECARKIETILRTHQDNGVAVNDDVKQEIDVLVKTLRSLAESS